MHREHLYVSLVKKIINLSLPSMNFRCEIVRAIPKKFPIHGVLNFWSMFYFSSTQICYSLFSSCAHHRELTFWIWHVYAIPLENSQKIEALHNKLQAQVRKIDGLVEQLSNAQAQKKELEQALKKEQLKISNKWRVETHMVVLGIARPFWVRVRLFTL